MGRAGGEREDVANHSLLTSGFVHLAVARQACKSVARNRTILLENNILAAVDTYIEAATNSQDC